MHLFVISQLKPNWMEDNDICHLYIFLLLSLINIFVWKGGLNMSVKTTCLNVAPTCPQTCSLWCAHDLSRFETSSVNKANKTWQNYPRKYILLDIPHNLTLLLLVHMLGGNWAEPSLAHGEKIKLLDGWDLCLVICSYATSRKAECAAPLMYEAQILR